MRFTTALAVLCLGGMSTIVGAQPYEPASRLQQKVLVQTPCEALAASFPNQVFYPGQLNYTQSQARYWAAQQTDLKPECRFFPETARHIQEALADVVLPRNISIAVVSGGYSSKQTGSNIHAGITFDLSSIKEVNFFLDAGKATWLGVGNRWQDVYPILETANLMVAGSQSGSVGVGGHVLGGGYSWHSSQHGWATDSVVEIEVVTPRAEILQVSTVKHEDLFWALKGSLGAFGIVTKIKMKTFPHHEVHGGYLDYQQKDMPQLCDALRSLAYGAEQDPTATGFLAFAWVEAKKNFLYRAHLMSTSGKTTGQFARFTAIEHLDSTLRTTSMAQSASAIDKLMPAGLRSSAFTLTTTMDPATMLALHELVQDSTTKIDFDAAGRLDVTYRPLTRPHLQEQHNFFNTGKVTGPLLLVVVELAWRDSTKDAYFEQTARELRRDMQSRLAQRDALHPFVYPGWAAPDQDPTAGLAPLHKEMLRAIKRKHDPDDVWRDLVPGIRHF